MKSPTIFKVNNKGPVAHNGKSATPNAANPKDPYFELDAKTMLYANQDEVAQLIGKSELWKSKSELSSKSDPISCIEGFTGH